VITSSVKVGAASMLGGPGTTSARGSSSTRRKSQTAPAPTRERISMRWPIDQKPSRPMPYWPATICWWRSAGDRLRLCERPMWVAR
jgi:hypothetical protein